MRDGKLQFRDPATAERLTARIDRLAERIDERVTLMHVCGTHEQTLAKFGLRSRLPANVTVRMGPGCPVCVTHLPEVDAAVALADDGYRVATFGDMVEVPGTTRSLADAKAAGADVDVVYSPSEAVDIAREHPDREVIFFATGFETTAALTAAILAAGSPENFSVLSAHKYVPPAMNVVAELPDTDIDGYLAAGHAATITGYGIFEDFVDRYEVPVVVGGFEPVDVLLAITLLLADIDDGASELTNAYPRCVDEAGNEIALETMWEVFETDSGVWRGIAEIPDASFVLRDEYAAWDATKRFDVDVSRSDRDERTQACRCGDIMAGLADPDDCELFEVECTPDDPVGACMVSSEGPCKIWHEYGGRPEI